MGTREVCVIGAGPRGLSVVERICTNAHTPTERTVVHLVDPYVGRGGRVWRTEQSPSLLTNTVASQVTMFTDDSVVCSGPVRPGPSLYEWARTLPLDPFLAYPDWVLAEAERLGPDSYPSRAFYGYYLNAVLRYVRETAPGHVSVHLHARTAVALSEERDGSLTVRMADGTRLAGLAAVVLAQGHVDMPPGAEEARLQRLASASGLRYLPSGSPAEVDLSGIGAGEPVILRGMGLCFFDHLVLLTVDRGGRFGREDGRLVYRPSGREPFIHAGSRRGVPYHARGENEKGVSGRHLPVFLTPEVIDGFRARAKRGDRARFRAEVWPLVAREVELVYYRLLVGQRRGTRAAREFAARYVAADQYEVDGLLTENGIGAADRWDWQRLARPHGSRHFGSPREYRDWLLGYLAADVAQAKRGNVSDPVKAALDVLRDIRNEVRLIVDHAGVSGSSYRDELRGWYTPLNAYLSIGPPAHRIEELIALVEAGVVEVLGPGMSVEVRDGAFHARSSTVDGSEVAARTLVEARLPEVDIRHTTDPLLRGLVRAGWCRPYRIPDADGPGYESGGLAVTPSPYHLVDAYGRPHERVFAYGIPTESVHWVTAAGARPGVNSVMLSDADAIAMMALSVAVPARVGSAA